MEMSRRARRMERHHKRNKRNATINLVSLMDIFTILVFFLLVNSSDAEVLPSTKVVKLPESAAEQPPKQTVVVMVTDKDIIVQGRKVASVNEVMNASTDLIGPLKEELDHQIKRSAKDRKDSEITIMGDKEIPYKLLKKIMVTCTSADYRNISLAVTKKEKPAAG